MEYKFDNVPIVLYIAFMFTLILFPVSWVVVSDKIKETIYRASKYYSTIKK